MLIKEKNTNVFIRKNAMFLCLKSLGMCDSDFTSILLKYDRKNQGYMIKG